MDHRSLKSEMRSRALAARSALSDSERNLKNTQIVAHGAQAVDFTAQDVISGFWPIRGEADILPLLEIFRSHGAKLALPAVVSREEIVFRQFEAGSDLVEGGFGTKAPGADRPAIDPTIMLVPLAAFDGFGHRIGYGAGFYDRVIANLRKKGLSPWLIGIAFDCQEVPSVPAEQHDIPLDYILTESGCRTIYS
jgi:5-formyltetrahydrofolate cyclo-ligase